MEQKILSRSTCCWSAEWAGEQSHSHLLYESNHWIHWHHDDALSVDSDTHLTLVRAGNSRTDELSTMCLFICQYLLKCALQYALHGHDLTDLANFCYPWHSHYRIYSWPFFNETLWLNRNDIDPHFDLDAGCYLQQYAVSARLYRRSDNACRCRRFYTERTARTSNSRRNVNKQVW